MTPTTAIAPADRVLEMLLALCRVDSIDQLSERDAHLMCDVLDVVDELAAATEAAIETRASSAAASDSGGSATSLHMVSSPTARSPSPYQAGVVQSRLKEPMPIAQFVPRCVGSAPTSTAGAYATSTREPRNVPAARRVRAPSHAAKKTPQRKPTAISKTRMSIPVAQYATPDLVTPHLREPVIFVTPRIEPMTRPAQRMGSPSSPLSLLGRPPLDSEFDFDLQMGISAQDVAEQTIATAVDQLKHVLEWRAHVSDDGELSVDVAARDFVHHVASQDVKIALIRLRKKVVGAVEDAGHHALSGVSPVWIHSPWLRARQRSIEQSANRVVDWLDDMCSVIDDCHNALGVKMPTNEDDASLPPQVWRVPSRAKDAVVDVYDTIAAKTISPPHERSLVHVQHGVSSFIVQLYGQLPRAIQLANAEADTPAAQRATMVLLSSVLPVLGVMGARCTQAAEKCRDIDLPRCQDLASWRAAFDGHHAIALHAIEAGLAACSRRICQAADFDLDDPATRQQLKLRYIGDTFHEDKYTLAYFEDVQHTIAKLHEYLSSAEPTSAAFADVVDDVLDEAYHIIDDLAVWVDPMFAAETASRPCERAAYASLIYWSQGLINELHEQCFMADNSIFERCGYESEEEDQEEDQDQEVDEREWED